MQKLSIIVPCYNEEETVDIFYNETSAVLGGMSDLDWEFIFVDDGSKDGTILALRRLAQADSHVRYLSFSRNFGKEAAMYAGLQAACGDFVSIMDVDLQDPPSMLPELLACVRTEGYDCAAVRRVTRRGEPRIRSFFARMFYKLVNKISRTEIVDGARDYRVMTRQMVDSILEITEVNRFSKGIFSWVGYSTKWFETENVQRSAGKTKWSFFKLLVYALDGMIAFSTAPLAVSSILGLLFCVISFLAIIFVIVRQLVWGGSAFGWPSLVCIILFLTGIQLFCIGILGQYIAKIHMEVKDRPIYIVRERGGGDES